MKKLLLLLLTISSCMHLPCSADEEKGTYKASKNVVEQVVEKADSTQASKKVVEKASSTQASKKVVKKAGSTKASKKVIKKAGSTKAWTIRGAAAVVIFGGIYVFDQHNKKSKREAERIEKQEELRKNREEEEREKKRIEEQEKENERLRKLEEEKQKIINEHEERVRQISSFYTKFPFLKSAKEDYDDNFYKINVRMPDPKELEKKHPDLEWDKIKKAFRDAGVLNKLWSLCNEVPSLAITKEEIDFMAENNKNHYDLDTIKVNYPKLDPKRIEEWLKDLENRVKGGKKSEWYQFGEKYTEALQNDYIGWDVPTKDNEIWKDFKKQMKQIGKETADLIKSLKNNKYRYKHVCFLVGGNVQKSNTWVFFALWPYIKDAVEKTGAKCHFIAEKGGHHISTEDTSSIFSREELKHIPLRDDILMMGFDGMAYRGTQMQNKTKYFQEDWSRLKELYLVMPYITHTAKRRIAGMDKQRGSRMLEFLQENSGLNAKMYVEGRFGYLGGDNTLTREIKQANMDPKTISERDFYQNFSKVKFMPSTKEFKEIPIPETGVLGFEGRLATATSTPIKGIADNASTIGGVTLYGLSIIDDYTDEMIEQFQPKSLFDIPKYTAEQKTAIRKMLWVLDSYSDWEDFDSDSKYMYSALRDFKSDLLPVQLRPIYKNLTLTLPNNKKFNTKGDTNSIFTILYVAKMEGREN